MALKKIIPFCFSVPVGAFGIVPMVAYISHGKFFEGLLFPGLAFIFALGIHRAVRNSGQGKTGQNAVYEETLLLASEPSYPMYNVDGSPMNGGVDVNGRPYGVL